MLGSVVFCAASGNDAGVVELLLGVASPSAPPSLDESVDVDSPWI